MTKIEIELDDLLHCPRCGVLLTMENFHSTVDKHLDEEYRWVECGCGWKAEG